MSDTRQQDLETPARDKQVEELQSKEPTKEQVDKVKGGLRRSLDGDGALIGN